MPGLTKEQVDKSCTSGLPTNTSKAPSTVASQAMPDSLIGKCINDTSPLHSRNKMQSGDYLLSSSPSDSALQQKVRKSGCCMTLVCIHLVGLLTNV